MIYHIFKYQIRGQWYRDSVTYSEQQFSSIMERLAWKLPYNVQAFHYGAPGSGFYALDNKIMLKYPILSLDIGALADAKLNGRAILCDRLRQQEHPVFCQLGRFVLAGGTQDGSNWPRLYYVDGIVAQLRVELQVIPLSFREAKGYVARYHRHNTAPQGHKFSIGLTAQNEEQCVGVAIASIPKARMQNDGYTLEINRVCCDPCYANACSKLYGAVVRSGRAMGYRRFITYTLPEESGSSVKAVGFHLDGIVPPTPDGWDTRKRPRALPTRYPAGQKLRWVLNVS